MLYILENISGLYLTTKSTEQNKKLDFACRKWSLFLLHKIFFFTLWHTFPVKSIFKFITDSSYGSAKRGILINLAFGAQHIF